MDNDKSAAFVQGKLEFGSVGCLFGRRNTKELKKNPRRKARNNNESNPLETLSTRIKHGLQRWGGWEGGSVSPPTHAKTTMIEEI